MGKILLGIGIAIQVFRLLMVFVMKSKYRKYGVQIQKNIKNIKIESEAGESILVNPFMNEEDLRKVAFFSIKQMMIMHFSSIFCIIAGLLLIIL